MKKFVCPRIGKSAAFGFVVSAGFSTAFAATSVPLSQTAYDIKAGPLASALTLWAEESHLKLFAPAEVTNELKTRGVNGVSTPPQALWALLEGTGLTYHFISAKTVTIEQEHVPAAAFYAQSQSLQLDTIDVVGANPNSTMIRPPAYAGGQVGSGGQLGLLGDRGVMDTPFNQTSYTSQTIEDQQARNLADVLLNDPSINLANSVASGTTTLYIRGFLVGLGDSGFNGLYGVAPAYSTSPYFMERVEVLKGPSALLGGMPPGGAVGGSVNIVPKRAADAPLTRFTTSYVSRGQFIEHVDIGRRFGQDNAIGVRINGAYSKGDTAVVGNRTEFGLFSVGVDYRGERIRLSSDFVYQDQYTNSSMRYVSASNTALTAVPQAPSASKTYTPAWEYVRTRDIFGTAQGEVDLTETTTAYAILGARRSNWNYLLATPSFTSTSGNITAAGEAANTGNESVAVQGGVRTRFETAFVKHAASLNVTESNQEGFYGYTSTGSFSTNIYNPSYVYPSVYAWNRTPKTSETRLGSVGIADTLSILNDRVQLTVGVRRQQVQTAAFSSSTGLQTSSYASGAWSPAYALVVKPWENVSLYANYIEGLQAGTTVGVTYANAGSVLPPYQSKQIETGVKLDWGRLITTASLFQIEQPNTIAKATTGSSLSTLALDGKQRNRGIEINTAGELTEGLRVLGGIMMIDPRLTHTAGGTTDGNQVAGVARFQLNLGAEWDTPFLPGFTLNGRVVHMSGQYVNSANTLSIPEWSRFDLGARYKFIGPWQKPVTVRFNVENILDKSAWAYVYYSAVSMMEPRTFVLSVATDF